MAEFKKIIFPTVEPAGIDYKKKKLIYSWISIIPLVFIFFLVTYLQFH
jgi:hypothetical protein